MKTRWLAIVMLALAAVAAGGPGAHAAAGDEAWLSAVAYHGLPAEAPVTVTPYDDNATNLRLKARFEEALQSKGRDTASEAPLRLVFETEVRYLAPAAKEPTLGRLEAGKGEGVDARVNVWSSNEDSLLTGRKRLDRNSRDQTHLLLSVRLRERDRGRVLWEGEARCLLTGRELEDAASALIPKLVAHLGESRARHSVDLRN
jgi:hypothetical protein